MEIEGKCFETFSNKSFQPFFCYGTCVPGPVAEEWLKGFVSYLFPPVLLHALSKNMYNCLLFLCYNYSMPFLLHLVLKFDYLFCLCRLEDCLHQLHDTHHLEQLDLRLCSISDYCNHISVEISDISGHLW